MRDRAVVWRAANPERYCEAIRAGGLRRRYGLTIAQYDEMLAAQGGVCAICRQPETYARLGKIQRLAIDHDHETGMIRGLLCNRCNRRLGGWEMFRKQAEAYLHLPT